MIFFYLLFFNSYSFLQKMVHTVVLYILFYNILEAVLGRNSCCGGSRPMGCERWLRHRTVVWYPDYPQFIFTRRPQVVPFYWPSCTEKMNSWVSCSLTDLARDWTWACRFVSKHANHYTMVQGEDLKICKVKGRVFYSWLNKT